MTALAAGLRKFRAAEWAGLALLLVATTGALWTVARGQAGLERHMIDSYYYFDAARNIQESGLPAISWPQGPENKFFPGYPYALAVAATLTGQEPHEIWRFLQLLLLAPLGLLTAFLLRGLRLPWAQAFVAGGIAVGNVIVLRWAAVAYSELLCLAALLGQGVLVAWRPEGSRLVRQVGFCALAGLAAATRVEALFFQPLLAVLDWRRTRLLTGSWISLVAWAMAGLGPLGLWMIWAGARESAALHYLAEGREEFSWLKYYQTLFTLAATNVRFYQFGGPSLQVYMGFRLLWYFFAASLILAPRGVLGRQALGAWAAVWLYWFTHAFWYFPSERYNLFVVPLIALLLVRMMAWFAMPGAPGRAAKAGRRAAIFWSLAGGVVLLQLNGWFVIAVHNRDINNNYMDADYQNVAFYLQSPSPGGILVDQAADFAYWQERPVWFAVDVPAFNEGLLERGADALEVLRKHDIRWLVLRRPVQEYEFFDQLRNQETQATVLALSDDREMWVYQLRVNE